MKDINLEEILNKAKEVQDKFQSIQKNFAEKRISDIAGIEDEEKIYIKATIDGSRIVKNYDVGDGVWQQDHKFIIDLFIEATNKATEKLNREMQSEVKKLYDSAATDNIQDDK